MVLHDEGQGQSETRVGEGVNKLNDRKLCLIKYLSKSIYLHFTPFCCKIKSVSLQ